MRTFDDLNLGASLRNAVDEAGFLHPTPIQLEAFSRIRSGKDIVGIAQTGTGKTIAYLLPLLKDFKFSKDNHAKIMIVVPTRELVLQVVEEANPSHLLSIFTAARTPEEYEKMLKEYDAAFKNTKLVYSGLNYYLDKINWQPPSNVLVIQGADDFIKHLNKVPV